MKSIGNKLIIYFSILILLVCSGFGLFAYTTTANAVIHETEKVLVQKSEDVGELIETEIETQLVFLEGVASRDRIISEENTIEDKLSILNEAVQKEGYLRIGVADLKGNLYLTDTYEKNGKIIDISSRDYYKESVKGKIGIMDPTVSLNPDDNGALIMVYSVPIKNKDDIVGVLVAIGDGNFISHITNRITYGEEGYVYVVNDKGTTIAHKNEEVVLKGMNMIEEAKKDKTLDTLAEQIKRMTARENGFGEYKYNGNEHYVGFAPIDDLRWSVAVTAPKSELLGALPKVQRDILIMTIGILILGVVVAFFVGRSIAKPITWATNYAEKVADLDIREDVEENLKVRKDEIGRLANAFQLVKENMQSFIQQVQKSSEQVTGASEQLKSTSEQSAQASEHVAIAAGDVAESASEQLSEVLNTTSAMEEISASIEEIASNAQEIHTLSNNVANKSVVGKEEINQVITQMNSIGESTDQVQNSLIEITDSSNKINDIIHVIKDISGQTNLLALNAAIEAARAGESGKGFAVVAEEVRKLAEETQRAAEEINDLIDKNQSNIDDANTTMDEASKEVEKGIDVVKVAEKTFGDITTSISQANNQIETIVQSIEQVADGSQEVVCSTNKIEDTSKDVAGQIQNISAATQEQTASMEEIASSSESLAQLAQELQEIIGQFKI